MFLFCCFCGGRSLGVELDIDIVVDWLDVIDWIVFVECVVEVVVFVVFEFVNVWFLVSLLFVDDVEVYVLNCEWCGKDKLINVLLFLMFECVDLFVFVVDGLFELFGDIVLVLEICV